MSKDTVADWSTTADDNTDVGGISLAEEVMRLPAVNDAFRALMAQIADTGIGNSAANTLKGNNTGSGAVPADLTALQVIALLSSARPYFLATKGGTSQTGIVANTHTLVTWSTEVVDNGSHFASNAWTPPAGPVYLFASLLYLATNLTLGDQIEVEIYKNGSLYQRSTGLVTSTSNGQGAAVNAFDVANGTDAYTVEIFTGASAGGGSRTVSGLATDTYFMGWSL